MYTKEQLQQLELLRSREGSESLTVQPVYWLTCDTCRASREFKSADGARSFIGNHAGHNTHIQAGRYERSG